MLRNLFPLAVQGTLRKKRSSILVFTVLLLSFAFAIVTLSLTQSISETNTQYRLDTFGEWYLAIPNGKEEDATWLAEQEWADKLSSVCSYGIIYPAFYGSYGTVDDTYLEVARASLSEGRLPEKEGEIAVERRVLEYIEGLGGGDLTTLGSTIPLPFGFESSASNDPSQWLKWMENGWISDKSESIGITTGDYFVLVGILDDFCGLWNYSNNKANQKPVCMIMTEETAQNCLNAVNKKLKEIYPGMVAEPTPQYYITVSPENRQTAARELGDYMKTTRNTSTEDFLPCVNEAAYPANLAVSSPDTFYSYLIAAVALVAVLCVYMMQLQHEAHSFAVLRSIGITKGQLLVLMGMEALILALPAMALGIPLGASLTKLALRLVMYSDGVSMRASIPYDALVSLFVLWLAVIVLARLILFAVTVRTPLTGKMQMQEKNARRSRRMRGALIAALLIAFSASLLYVMEAAQIPTLQKAIREADPDYEFMAALDTSENDRGKEIPISHAAMERFAALPGIESAEGYMVVLSGRGNASELSISFDGLEETFTNFYMLDAERWADALRLDEETAAAFARGDIVLLGFDEYNLTEETPLPQGDVTLRAYEDGECVAVASATPVVWMDTDVKTFGRSPSVTVPYTVYCTEAYLRKLVAAIEPGKQWDAYTCDGPFGYSRMWLTASANAGALSIDYSIMELCRQEGLRYPLDNRESKQTEIQDYSQQLILLYACGGCIVLVTLLLFASALALEAEQEKRSFAILRVIGMSKRQMRRKVFGKAARRSVLTFLTGWALTIGITARQYMRIYERPLLLSLKSSLSNHTMLFYNRPAWFVFAAVCILVMLGVSLLAKRALKESTLLK